MPQGRGFRERENWKKQGAPGQGLSMLFHCTHRAGHVWHNTATTDHVSNRRSVCYR